MYPVPGGLFPSFTNPLTPNEHIMMPSAIIPTIINIIIRSTGSPIIRSKKKDIPEITIKEIPRTVSSFSSNPTAVYVSNLIFGEERK